MTSESSRPNSRKSDGKSKRSSGVGSKHSEIKPAESDRPRLGSIRSRNERRRSVESLEAKTRDLDIGGRGSPQPPESPGDPIDPSMDPSLRDYEVASKAIERFKDNKRHDSHKSGGEEEPRRRRRSSRHHDEEGRSSKSRLVKRTTTTRTTFDKLPFLARKEKVVDKFEYEKSSDNRDNDRNLPSSDRRYADSSRRSYRSGEEKRTERKIREPFLAGSNVSSPKTSVSSEPKSATSSKHSAHTHRSARSARSAVNDIQAPQAGSHHPSESPSSRKSHKESDDEPKALSEGSASGTLHGRLPRSNTSASDRQSLSERNLNDIYKPDRGGKRTSTTAPSDHGTAERAQTGYGRGDHSNPPYFYEDETNKSDISASTSGTTRGRRTHKS
ncbi:uncharacterized protein EAF02_002351 [Botrytis sinoallii]|uniref:uncharacterized protein n=1 Tax=Botrytis sinoallii TaxID=1463999 RepID=UPI0018FF375A|nr:uncharacterized protein EAF02_002351 [Botrytis sinoallii]KAF7889936.1 hypothetical protein EAF02_002351 [Botrytis sinoallii]